MEGNNKEMRSNSNHSNPVNFIDTENIIAFNTTKKTIWTIDLKKIPHGKYLDYWVLYRQYAINATGP